MPICPKAVCSFCNDPLKWRLNLRLEVEGTMYRYWLVMGMGFLLDQVTKMLVVSRVALGERISVIDGFFAITHWKNLGAAWGILQQQRLFLIVMTLIAGVFLGVYFKKISVPFMRYAISCVIGGALGNLYDRLFREEGVVDFLLFQFGRYTFPTFNIADTLIVVGSSLMFIFVLFEEKFKEKFKKKMEM